MSHRYVCPGKIGYMSFITLKTWFFCLFILLFSFSPAMSLTGEFISDSGSVDKIELAGVSAIVTSGGVSTSYLLKEKDGYITLISSSESAVITIKISDDGLSLFCKTGNCEGQMFNKYIEPVSTRLTGFCSDIVPKKPIIAYTSPSDGVKIHLTGNFISKIGDGDRDKAISQASLILLNCASNASLNGYNFKGFKELCFDNYESLLTLYVKDESALQRLLAAKSDEQKWNILVSYSEQWGETMLPLISPVVSSREIRSLCVYWVLLYNGYIYSKFFEGFPNTKSRSDVKFSSKWKDKIAFLNEMGLLFVICDNNWIPKFWIDYYKDYLIGGGMVKNRSSMSVDAIYKVYNYLISDSIFVK